MYAVCVNEYLRGTILERIPSKIMMGLADDDPVYKAYRLALVSASKEESLVRISIDFGFQIQILNICCACIWIYYTYVSMHFFCTCIIYVHTCNMFIHIHT